jgi:hypothetical protein
MNMSHSYSSISKQDLETKVDLERWVGNGNFLAVCYQVRHFLLQIGPRCLL